MFFTVWDHRSHPRTPIHYIIRINSKTITVRELQKRILAGSEGCIKYPLGQDGNFISLQEYNRANEIKYKEVTSAAKDTILRQFFGKRDIVVTVDSSSNEGEEPDAPVVESIEINRLKEDVKYLEFHNARLEKESERNCKLLDEAVNRELKDCSPTSQSTLKHRISELEYDNMELKDEIRAVVSMVDLKEAILESFTINTEKLKNRVQLQDKIIKDTTCENSNLNQVITQMLENEPARATEPSSKTDFEKMNVVELREVRGKMQADFASDFNFIQTVIDKKVETKTTSSDCVICLDQKSDTVLIPCGHICICSHCSKSHRGPCPLCRQEITTVHRVYQ